MAGLGQALTGKRASTPKVCRVMGDDNAKVIYKNMGNNHNYPVIWADTVTVVSGATQAVVCSGITFHGYDVATYGNVTASPKGNLGYFYLTHDTVTNKVTFICSSAAGAGGTDVSVQVILGVDPDMEAMYCRGNTGASQALP